MTRTFLLAVLAATFTIACNSSDNYQTDDVFSLQAVIWTCNVTCIEDGNTDQAISCSHAREIAEAETMWARCGDDDGFSAECTTTYQTCTEGQPDLPPSPAW